MIVLTHGHEIYYPKLDIQGCVTIHCLYGDVTAPLLDLSLDKQVLLLSLSLRKYKLSNDKLYELIDDIDDITQVIMDLYIEGGIINNSIPQDTGDDTSSDSDNSENVDFEEHMKDLLDQCMSIGMTEEEFYSSTLTQVTRYVKAHNQKQMNKMQEQAYFDYQLANLIGMSVARLLSKDAKFPKFEDVYPFINNNQETNSVGEGGMTIEERQAELNRIRLMEWASQMNNKFKEGEVE